MLNLHRNIVLDENEKPIAVQIPIDEFQRLEEVIENYGLSKLIDEVADDEPLTVHEARSLYRTMKDNFVNTGFSHNWTL
jgi:RelB Antitoxin alpha helical domain